MSGVVREFIAAKDAIRQYLEQVELHRAQRVFVDNAETLRASAGI